MRACVPACESLLPPKREYHKIKNCVLNSLHYSQKSSYKTFTHEMSSTFKIQSYKNIKMLFFRLLFKISILIDLQDIFLENTDDYEV